VKTMKNKVLVVAAHPDDEVLGCGATIAKYIHDGDEVHVVILAEGLTARDATRDRAVREDELSELTQMAHKAHAILGSNSLVLHNFPDNRMDSIDRLDVTKVVESFVKKYEPNIIYTHHAGDVNIDHRRVHEAVVTACRPMQDCPVRTILFFEIASSTEWQPSGSAPYFMPNWFVDVTSTLSLKIQALHAYAPEMREFPHPRSFKGLEVLAQWRGAMVGMHAAEAFMLGRCLK